ncbi:hypothetical protein G6F65_021167 [Rhizopus arrhizus]|nr:hypothetical protein G6F65_021167 [Rhizopus arrhizus]
MTNGRYSAATCAVVGRSVLVDLRHAERTAEGIAAPTAVIGRPRVGNDPRGYDLRPRRDAPRPRPYRCTGGQAGHRGAVADHIVDRQVVPGRIDVVEVGQHPSVQRHRIALHPGINDADTHALPGQARCLCGTRVGD